MDSERSDESMAQQFKLLLHKMRWTQRDLKDYVTENVGPVSNSTVYRWMAGKADPPLAAVIALARMLGLSLDEFVTGKPSAPPSADVDRPILSEEQRKILWLAETIGFEKAVARLVRHPSDR